MRRIWWAFACAVICAAVATGAYASTRAYSLGPTEHCLAKYHVVMTPLSTKRPIVPAQAIADFVFDGVPAYTVDTGQFIFESNGAAARSALVTLDRYWINYDVAKRHEKRATVVAEFKVTQQVNGNVIVWWNNYPQSAAAKRVIRSCLH